jgi:hypothetical protein
VDTSLAAALGLGFVLGVRHALDADHIVAVAALVSQHRSLARSCLLGGCWGAGHTAALLAAAVAVIAFKVTISPAVEHALEQAVATLLILLGGHVLLRSCAGAGLHRHEHTHDGHRHAHLHVHAHDGPSNEGVPASHGHRHLVSLGGRPFLVGLLHGMAGSATLMLLTLTTVPSVVGGLVYVLVFAVGSTAGMLLLSGLIGIPFVLTAGRSRSALAGLQALAGAASILLGCWLAWSLAGA